MSAESKLLVTVQYNRAHVTVVGEGSVDQAVALKRFYRNALLEGIDDFTLELKDCTSLDSTFLGVVLGMALKLKAACGQFRARNARMEVAFQIANLGLDRLFSSEKQS